MIRNERGNPNNPALLRKIEPVFDFGLEKNEILPAKYVCRLMRIGKQTAGIKEDRHEFFTPFLLHGYTLFHTCALSTALVGFHSIPEAAYVRYRGALRAHRNEPVLALAFLLRITPELAGVFNRSHYDKKMPIWKICALVEQIPIPQPSVPVARRDSIVAGSQA